MQIESTKKINSISDLPKITSLVLPKEFELLPKTSEVFELEFAFYEYKFLTKDEIIRKGAFFKALMKFLPTIISFAQIIVLLYGKGGQK